MTSDKF